MNTFVVWLNIWGMFSISKAGERAQLIKGLLSRHEDLEYDPHDAPTKNCEMICPCNLSAGEGDTGGCLGIAGQPVYLACLVSSDPESKLVSKKKSRQCLRNDTYVHICTSSLIHI